MFDAECCCRLTAGIGTPYFLSPEICRVLSCGDQQLKTISAAGEDAAALQDTLSG